MPVKVKNEKLILLEANSQLPKMFKEFPLIGCQDTGFNYVFSSKLFYPNENRSGLLLKQMEGRESKKPKSNWDSIEAITIMGLELYKRISEVISEGHENLLIVPVENLFTKGDQDDNNKESMKKIFEKYKTTISELPFLIFQYGIKGRLKDLIFPFGESENHQTEK